MNKLTIAQLPFYWRLATPQEKRSSIVGDRYPFAFDLRSDLGLVIQQRNADVLAALNLVYQQEHNIGYLQDGNELARPYGTDFMRYLDDVLAGHQGIRNILEVGCGGCVLLSDLQKRGYATTGIDSSPFAAIEGRKKGVRVLTDFFPSPKLTEMYDMIFHVDVLEHIDEPVAFLKQHRERLNAGGVVVINVPDATESIAIGDISMAMHQHLNYFTEASLKNTLEASGFQVLSVDRAKYGGSLYAVGRRLEDGEWNSVISRSPGAAIEEYTAFVEKAHGVIAAVGRAVAQTRSVPGSTLGFYVPLRSLPYISAIPVTEPFRLFDDTGHWHRKEFDGLDVPIENFGDLKKQPVSDIIIMSLTFGEVIKKKMAAEFGTAIRVSTLSELAGGGAQ